jgi:hypothetical protein
MPHRKKPGTPVSVRSQREKRRKLRAKLTPVDVRGPGPHPRKRPGPLRSIGSSLRSAANIAARRAMSKKPRATPTPVDVRKARARSNKLRAAIRAAMGATKPTVKLTPVEARKKRKGNSARRK